MTDDPLDQPTPRRGRSTDEDAAWFRAAVAPLVDRPVPDAWAEIRERATSGGVLVETPAAAPARRHPALLVAAAVAAFLVAAGTVVALGREDADRDRVSADAPAGPSGFYVPGTLPAGWELTYLAEQVDQTPRGLCPCELATWRSGDRVLSARRLAASVEPDPRAEPWAGAPGGTRWVDPSGDVSYTWRTGEVLTLVQATGFDGAAEADPPVEAWVGAALDDPPGFDLVHRGEIDADVRAITRATGLFHHDELDLDVPFELAPDPLGEATALAATGEPSTTLPGSGLRLVRWAGSEPGYRGAWPGGASFAIGTGLAEGATSEAVTDDQVLALADAFRPASAGGWRAFVEGARSAGRDQRADDLLRAALVEPRLADLVLRDGDPLPAEELGDLATDGPPGDDVPAYEVPPSPGEGVDPPQLPTTPETPATSTTVPADPDGSITIEAGPLAGLAATIEAPDGPFAPGERFEVGVTVTNPTDETIELPPCFPALASWWIERGGRRLGGGGNHAIDCGDGPTTLAPGASRPIGSRLGASAKTSFGFVAAEEELGRGEPLTPGDYRIVIRFEGGDSQVAAPITIG